VDEARRLESRWQEILDFEKETELQASRSAVRKERAIRERFGVSAARYHQVLGRLLEGQDAFQYDPVLVQRLARVRETRRAKRFARRLGLEG
jgi:hypothetical protein